MPFKTLCVKNVLTLPYGGCEVSVKPSGGFIREVKPRFGRILGSGEVREAIVDGVRDYLSGKVKPGFKVAIAVPDSTRPTPSSLIASTVIRELEGLGVRSDDITVLIATGMHSPEDRNSILRILGEEVVNRVRVVNNNPYDDSTLAELGSTSLGTTIQVNKLFAEADVKIIAGTIGPCMLTGWSGGGKTVMPGVSSRRSIHENHKLFVRNVRNARRGAMFGLIEGNAVRQDIDDYAQRVGVDLIVNVIQDHKGSVLGVYVGDVVKTFYRAQAFARDALSSSEPVEGEADIAVVSPGVFSHEVSLYQSGSRMLAAVEGLVKSGGSIILVSSCYKGIYEGAEVEGFKDFFVKYDDVEEVLDLTERDVIPSFESCIGYQFLWMTRNFNVCVVSNNLSSSDLKMFRMKHYLSVDDALSDALKIHGKDSAIIAIPYASITYTVKK